LIFLALKLIGVGYQRECVARAWVNTDNGEEAVTRLAPELEKAGWKLLGTPEWEATTEADYFSPCTSLDAFHRASQEGIVVLY